MHAENVARQRCDDQLPLKLQPTELVAFIQHEAGNSLQRVLKNAYQLRRLAAQLPGEELPQEWWFALRDIEVEAKDLGRLVVALPQITSGCPVDLEPMLLQRVIPQVVLERWRGGDLRVAVTEMCKDLPAVRANPDLLRIVLHNVLANAEKYTPDSSPIELSAIRWGNTVHLCVRDYGPGLQPDELDSIFEFFFRGSRQREAAPGMGVGLALCRMLMTAMGGRMIASLPEGPGLEFTIELPMLDYS